VIINEPFANNLALIAAGSSSDTTRWRAKIQNPVPRSVISKLQHFTGNIPQSTEGGDRRTLVV